MCFDVIYECCKCGRDRIRIVYCMEKKNAFYFICIVKYYFNSRTFTIGLNIDAKLESDPTVGTVYAFLLFFGTLTVIVVSILCFLILGLIQLIIRRSNE